MSLHPSSLSSQLQEFGGLFSFSRNTSGFSLCQSVALSTPQHSNYMEREKREREWVGEGFATLKLYGEREERESELERGLQHSNYMEREKRERVGWRGVCNTQTIWRERRERVWVGEGFATLKLYGEREERESGSERGLRKAQFLHKTFEPCKKCVQRARRPGNKADLIPSVFYQRFYSSYDYMYKVLLVLTVSWTLLTALLTSLSKPSDVLLNRYLITASSIRSLTSSVYR